MQGLSLAVFFAVQRIDHGLVGVVCSGVCWRGYGAVLLLLLGASALSGGGGGTSHQSLRAQGMAT
jgi:hypothetical protein